MSSSRLDNFLNFFNIDNISDFVNKYLTQIIIFFALIGLLSFAIVFIKEQKNDKNNILTERYYRALKLADSEAKPILKDIYVNKKNNAKIRSISGLKLAEILALEDDKDEIIIIYKNIFNFKKNDLFLKNLAGLNLLTMFVNQNKTEIYSEIDNLLLELKTNNPLINLVLEQEAMFEIQRGNKEKAQKILNELISKDLDDDLNSRVQLLLLLD